MSSRCQPDYTNKTQKILGKNDRTYLYKAKEKYRKQKINDLENPVMGF